MKILSDNFNSPYQYFQHFGAKSKDVKRADDIQRRARAEFPMISPTYAEEYYHCVRKGSKNYKRADKLTKNIWNNVSLQRNLAGLHRKFGMFNSFDRDDSISHMKDLEWVKEWRLGCCDESAKTALAVLCANGFYNSAETCLWCEGKFINKESGEIEYTNRRVVPHCFVVTNFGADPKTYDPKKDIVVDPWLGFADYKSAAVARFKQAFSDDIDDIKKNLREDFIKHMLQKREYFKLSDYEMKTSFVFKVQDLRFEPYLRELGCQVREKYPGTVLDINA